MKKMYAALFLPLLLLIAVAFTPGQTFAVNEPTKCSGTVIDLGFPKKLLSFSELSRPGTCGVKPTKIVLHTTWGVTSAEDQFNYFENKPEGRYASTQFVVGKDGQVLQMAETLADKVEITWAVAGYNDDSVSIELGCQCDYTSKSEVPPAQYASTLKLVQALMKAYNIPLGDMDETVINNSNKAGDGKIQKSTQGIFGHYQLSPDDRTDPGQGFLRDIRADLKAGGALTSEGITSGNPDHAVSCVITKVGNPKTSPPPFPPECSDSSGGAGGACQTPPQPYPADPRQEMISKWGITFNGYDQDHLKWAYEELYAISSTKFLQLAKGAVIEATPESISQQVGCPGQPVAVRLHPYDEVGFKTLITHELTHTFQWCQSEEVSHFSEIHNAIATEGYVSNYSRTACLGGIVQANEDYADTVAYYLNPTAPEFTCGNGAGNPYANGEHPAHKALAEKIVGSYSCSK
jgi:hypothetical protein